MSGGPLLIDVSCLCDEHTDGALEYIHKAIGEDPPDNGIWEPHPNPFVRRLVELFTERGIERSAGVQAELQRWLAGAEHSDALTRPPRPSPMMARWSQAELGIARLYLQSLPPESFIMDDWMLLVDYLVQRYLPASDLRTEAEWLATRSNMMGRVQAALGEATEAAADRYVMALPDLEDAARAFGMSPAQRATIEYGRARCAEHVVGLTDGLRQRMRNLIVDYQEAQALGDRAAAGEALQSRLLDTFGTLNRDWRRIAVTEATENVNQGFVAAAGPGARLRRVEKYRGACPFCRSIDGRVVTVVDAAQPEKNGDTEIWVGKTNVGRSASPSKRVGGALVERGAEERWWIAAGAMHPHCRGAWVRVVSDLPDDPEFEAWLAKMDRDRGKE
jgi:hypothetical protein